MELNRPIEIVSEHSTSRISNSSSNNAGRPKKKNEIKFTAPPKSIISALLSNEKSKNEVAHTNDSNIANKDSHEPCTRKSSNPIEYKQEMNLHKSLHCCRYPNCTYSTNFSSNLIKHKRTHTSEKPYVCDKCSFRTNFQNSLIVHQRIHTSEKPYLCQYCDYRCNSSSNLKKHCYHRHSKDKTINMC